MPHIENLERRVLFSANAIVAFAKITPSIDIAVAGVGSSFPNSAAPGAKGIETIILQNLGGVTARGKITFVLSITNATGTAYPLGVTQPTRGISLRPQAEKTFRVHVALPPSLASDPSYIVTGACNVLSGFTDPDPQNNAANFGSTPMAIESGGSGGNVGYFTFSPFAATNVYGSAKAHIFGESGTVTAFPGGSVEYTYMEQYGIGTLQILTTTSDDQFADLEFSILHRAPTRLNGKTITFVSSKKGASGSGNLIEEGFAVPGITYNAQVAYFKLT